MLTSIFYSLSFIILFITCFLARKNNCTHHSGFAQIVIHMGVIMWINAMAAGIYGLIHIPFNLVSLSLIYIILSIFFIFYIKKNGFQKYSWKLDDALWLILITLIALRIGLLIHTPRLLIADVSGDTCNHYRFVLKVIQNQNVKGEMYFSPVNNAIFTLLLKPFLQDYQSYKTFIAMGIMMLALSGCVFYAVIRDRLNTRPARFLGFAVSLLYMLGYPLHNELMGFVHLGMSVTITAILFYIFHLYHKRILCEKWAIPLLMLGCHALVMCYMLFAPVLYIALFICLCIHCYKKVSFLSFAKKALQIFLIPCVIAIYYCYFNYFMAEGLNVSDVAATNGGTHGKMYSYLLILLPGTLYMIFSETKKKRNMETIVLSLCTIACSVGVLALTYRGHFSYYYYTKFLYLLWFVLSLSAFWGLLKMQQRDKALYRSYITFMSILAIIFVSNINSKLAEASQAIGYNIAEDYRTISYGIYDENQFLLHNSIRPYDSNKLKLFIYAKGHLPEETIPVVGDLLNYMDVFWCENITEKNLENYYYWGEDPSVTLDRLAIQKETSYVIILYGTSIYEDNKAIWDQYDKIYETGSGCILKLRS